MVHEPWEPHFSVSRPRLFFLNVRLSSGAAGVGVAVDLPNVRACYFETSRNFSRVGARACMVYQFVMKCD